MENLYIENQIETTETAELKKEKYKISVQITCTEIGELTAEEFEFMGLDLSELYYMLEKKFYKTRYKAKPDSKSEQDVKGGSTEA